MSAAREAVLARIRAALRDVPAAERAEDVAVARDYALRGTLGPAAIVDRFAQRLGEYRADVRRVAADEVAGEVARICREHGLRSLAAPAALPTAWRSHGLELLDAGALTVAALAAVDGALTGCAAAIAETGTILLDGRDVSGRRPLSLVCDDHLCVVRHDQIVETVPEGLARVAPEPGTTPPPLTLISGPSATSDIELTRVEGVHGPRRLTVLLIEPSRGTVPLEGG